MNKFLESLIEPFVVRETPKPYRAAYPQPPKPSFKTPSVNHRPLTWADVEGQKNAKEKLQIMVEASKRSGQPMSHLLITGPSGVGKTTIVKIVASSLGVEAKTIFAPRITKFETILDVFKSCRAGDVVFIDEAQKLSSSMQQSLYDILEDFVIHDTRGDIKLPKLTVCMATTHEGQLLEALRRRCATVELCLYTVDELTNVILKSAQNQYKFQLDNRIARRLAALAWGVPYKALWLLKSLVTVCQSRMKPGASLTSSDVTQSDVEKMLKTENIDPIIGLNTDARRYLSILTRNPGSAKGLDTLVTILHIPMETLETVIEPLLMGDVKLNGQVGPLVEPTSRGRVATALANTYLNMCYDLQRTQGYFSGEDFLSYGRK